MKNRNIAPYLLATGTLLMPFVAFAQTGIIGALGVAQQILDLVFPLLIGLAAIYFVWGLIQYVGASKDDGAKAEARSIMLYGIIIIAVILGIWGLAGILLNTLGVTPGGTTQFPQLP